MLPERGLEVASNRPLRDGGVTLWEGGIRVPCCFRWPDVIPAGTECREPLSSLDLFPMLLSAAGIHIKTADNSGRWTVKCRRPLYRKPTVESRLFGAN